MVSDEVTIRSSSRPDEHLQTGEKVLLLLVRKAVEFEATQNQRNPFNAPYSICCGPSFPDKAPDFHI